MKLASVKFSWMLIGALLGIAVVDFAAGQETAPPAKQPRVVYPKQTQLDFSGLQIQAEVRNPGEFYFQQRKSEKFDSLVKRRKDFHREMLRDAVLTR